MITTKILWQITPPLPAMSCSNSKPYLLITLIAYSTFSLCLSQTIDFQIDDFSSQNAKDILIFDRDAHVPEGSILARLIKTDASGNPQKSSVGRVLYKSPITFRGPGRQLSFEVTLQFQITTVNRDPADGLTFFIVPAGSISPTGGVGDGLGIFGALNPSSSPIFAVDFDVYVNGDLGQRFRQIGINIDRRRSGNATLLEDAAFDRVVNARIQYEATTRRITVSATFGNQAPVVSQVYDLKRSLPPQVQIGVSSSTGDQVAYFDLLKWYFIGTLVADNSFEETYVRQYV